MDGYHDTIPSTFYVGGIFDEKEAHHSHRGLPRRPTHHRRHRCASAQYQSRRPDRTHQNGEKIEKLFTQIDNPQISSTLHTEIEDETVIKEVVEKLTDCKLSDKGKVSSIPYQEGEFKAILIVHFNSKDARIYLKENGEFYVFENNVYQKYTCNDSTVTDLYHDLFAITMSENAPID